MSDEVEKVKESDPDFMLHQHKPAADPEKLKPAEDADGSDDFELHQYRPAGQLKEHGTVNKLKEI